MICGKCDSGKLEWSVRKGRIAGEERHRPCKWELQARCGWVWRSGGVLIRGQNYLSTIRYPIKPYKGSKGTLGRQKHKGKKKFGREWMGDCDGVQQQRKDQSVRSK